MSDLTDQEHNLFLAVSFGKIHRVKAALSDIQNINIRNHDLQTLLIQATHTHTGTMCIQFVRMLVKAGVNINAQDIHGRSALMYACADTNIDDAVRYLIRQPNCDPNLVDCEGNTALMFAVAADSWAAVEILMQHHKIRNKLNINIKNNAKLTALDMAVALKSVACCKAIVDAKGHDIAAIEDEDGLSALVGTTIECSV